MKNFGFVGMGNMAQAIAAGFVAAKKIASENLFAFAPNQKKLCENAKKIGWLLCQISRYDGIREVTIFY